MDAAAARAWLDAYGRAWEQRDPAAAGALFAEDALYAETPFDEPMRGRAAIEAYWGAVPREQRDVEFEHELLAVDGERVIALWRARYVRVRDGAPNRLDGVFVLRFGADGRCRELREWWHASGETAF